MLAWRILLGAVLIAALIGLFVVDHQSPRPGIVLYPFAILVCLAASHELVGLLRNGGLKPSAGVVYAGNLLILLSNATAYCPASLADARDSLGLTAPMVAFTVAALAAFVVELARYKRPGEAIARAAATLLALFYLGLLISFLLQLRVLGGAPSGLVALVALLVVVKFGDIGAYTVGRLVGKHKLAPIVSPGKTIEGALGGLAFSCLGAWLVFRFLQPKLMPTASVGWDWLIFGVVVGAAGMLGDLIESLLKRDMGVKDSSTWMPGFGGILDVIDSVLVATPAAYVCWWWMTVRPGGV